MNKLGRYPNSALLTICLLATGALFVKCFSHDWSYDDTPVIVANQDIRSLADFFADQYPGRPLCELSYWFDFRLWGPNPAGFMVQNLFWLGLCAGLLSLLLLRLEVAWLLSCWRCSAISRPARKSGHSGPGQVRL